MFFPLFETDHADGFLLLEPNLPNLGNRKYRELIFLENGKCPI